MDIEITKIQYKILNSFQLHGLSKVNYSADLIARDTKISIYIIRENLPSLLESKLIEIDPLTNETTYYRISNKGKSILLNQKEETKEKLLWSVWIPLVTAVAGSLITNLLFPK